MAKTVVERKVLYGGEVIIDFYPNSHQYKLIEGDKKTNLPSVTSITGLVDKSRVLMSWAVRVMKEKAIELLGKNGTYSYEDIMSVLNASENAYAEARDKAAGIGDYVHLFAERYASLKDFTKAFEAMVAELGEPIGEDLVKINAGCLGLVGWIKENKVNIIESEQFVYSKKHGFVGTFDAVAEMLGGTYLIDYKTSNGIYDEHYYQTSAYLKAKEEETGKRYDGGAIIGIAKEDKLDKDGNVIKRAGEITVVVRSRADLVKDYIVFKALIKVKNRQKELQAEYYNNK